MTPTEAADRPRLLHHWQTLPASDDVGAYITFRCVYCGDTDHGNHGTDFCEAAEAALSLKVDAGIHPKPTLRLYDTVDGKVGAFSPELQEAWSRAGEGGVCERCGGIVGSEWGHLVCPVCGDERQAAIDAAIDNRDNARDRHQSLREYAKAALTGMCANTECNGSFEGFARDAWKYAEAMQAEDDKRREAGL